MVTKARTIKQCGCGCANFIVRESIVWQASFDDYFNTLWAVDPEQGIESVTCAGCGKEYEASYFTNVEFNT